MRQVNIPSSSVLEDPQKRIWAIKDLYSYIHELAQGAGSSSSTDDSQQEAINKLNNEVYTLKQQIGNLGGDVTYEYPNELGKSFTSLLNNSGTVKLQEDVTSGRYGPGILAKNHTTLNLNGHNLTITNAGSNAGIQARGTQEITITGSGTIDSGTSICIMCNGADAVINLKGSTTTYTTNRPSAELIYCYNGTINISGGVFKNGGSPYLLNCYDANYQSGKAKIVVTGGKFYDFDPANSMSEPGGPVSFLAEGYTSVASTVTEDGVEHTVYTVKKA